MNTMAKILARLIIGEPQTLPTPCWEWPGPRDTGHYGQVSFQGRQWRVHRLVYERLVEKMPEGMELDHECRNRICANPAHLKVITTAEHRQHEQHPYEPPAVRIYTNRRHCPHGAAKITDCRHCERERMRDWSRERRAEKQQCRQGHPLINRGTRSDGTPHRFCPTCLSKAGKKGGWPAQTRNQHS